MSLLLFSEADATRRAALGRQRVQALQAEREAAVWVDLAALQQASAAAVLRVGAALTDALRAEGATALVVGLPTEPPVDPWQAGFALRRHAAEPVWWWQPPEPGATDEGHLLEIEPWAPRPPIVETARLRLTFPTPEQVRDYHHRVVGTAVFDTICWDGPSDEAALPDYWLGAARAFTEGASGLLSLAMIEQATDRYVGGISLLPLDGDPGVQELGYALAPDAWGQGFATEAVRALLEVAFVHRGVRRLVARVFEGNTASERVLIKAGFTLEGRAPAQHQKRGRIVDGLVFGLSRTAWQPTPGLRRIRLSPT